ncbi:MAG: low molecular weight phosphotyrosine protein phosphatase [Bacilli bacterium]|nr:low molecular weight phosphotyrosine protein phosphatase [Bacilli bacterium]
MIKVLFVCHGNICRSPMAEFIMKDMVKKLSVDDLFEIDSCATSKEELGNSIYPSALKTLKSHGIFNANHTARQITIHDYRYYDYIFIMDNYNLKMIKYVLNLDNYDKIKLIGDYLQPGLCIEDPWYSGNFDLVYEQLSCSIKKFLKEKLIEVKR